MRFALRFLLVVVTTGVYLGLAILGWRRALFFANPARTTLAIVTFAIAMVAMFAGGNLSAGVREDRGNRWVLAAFAVLGILDGFLPAYWDRRGIWVVGSEAIRWWGVAIFAVGCTLRIWPVFVLGRRFSGLVAIQSVHTLVTTGIYRYIRNPSYLGLLLTALGWALAFRSGVGLLIGALLLAPLIARIHSEERLLTSHFGAEYRTYVEHTYRLIPGIY